MELKKRLPAMNMNKTSSMKTIEEQVEIVLVALMSGVKYDECREYVLHMAFKYGKMDSVSLRKFSPKIRSHENFEKSGNKHNEVLNNSQVQLEETASSTYFVGNEAG